MGRSLTKQLIQAGAVFGAVGLAACAGGGNQKGGEWSAFESTPLDRYVPTARETTAYLEVAARPANAVQRERDLDQIRDFVRGYVVRGHGPLVLAAPDDAEEQVEQARAIAFAHGVEYREIETEAASGGEMTLAYLRYEAVKPDCPSLAEQDLSKTASNSELPGFGCSVNFNLAAMISDPADLLGARAADPSDPVRRRIQFELYREGADTAAEPGRVQSTVQINSGQ